MNVRAWDDVAKKMSYGSFEQMDDSLLIRFGQFETETPVYMKGSGFKDKKGKEIYEKDSLKCSIPVEIIDNGLASIDGETVIAKIIYENGCFWAEGKTVNYPWVLNGDKTLLLWLLEIDAYGKYPITVEVVGNEYESAVA